MQDIRDCFESLARVPSVLTAMVQDIPTDRLRLRRGGNCWTILEHVAHLAEVQPMLSKRIQRIISENVPEFIPFNPTEDTYRPKVEDFTVQELLLSFTTERNNQIELLSSCDPNVWAKAAVHPEYTQYGMNILVRHILMHDYWHMYRIEELWLMKDEFLPH